MPAREHWGIVDSSGESEEPVALEKFENSAPKFNICRLGMERFNGSGGDWIW
jgi:hypothetical protein